ncbi:MAG: protein kinase domain-containing protein, partial [Planctomycetota bacterium]
MIGQHLGPHTIEAELGTGGMGTVYRATGPEGRVAIKVVHPHMLASPGFFERFLREGRIGKSVQHENVVRTMDCDQLEIDGRPLAYLVMEYVAGKSLRQLLHDLGTIPETLLREIALQTAAGLAAIHAAGIVHRDIKPENILITDDNEIRIMDLGVAKLQEATIQLTREGQFAGSLLYAAPEQFRSDVEVGPAADLYSLGVSLCELATGANPFQRDDAAQVIHAHLEFKPRRIFEQNPDATPFLSELVACLLEKQPDRRFESAEALHHVLREGERSPWWTNLASRLERDEMRHPQIRVPRETGLHGRGRELELLHDAWTRAKGGDGNTVWIDGEAGIGKTRLLAEFLERIEDDAHFLYGSYPPSGGLGGFSDSILGHFGEVDLEERLSPYLTATPLLVPAFAALVTHDAPPEGAEPIQGDALAAMGVNLMRALSAEKPTIWLVEDLHFAPRESRDVALSLSRAVEGHRALLVYTARPGVPEGEREHFDRLQNLQRVQLARLSGREIIELLEDAFKSEALTDKLGAKIARKSDGVPFFVFEMIRGLKEGRFIQQELDGSYVLSKVIDEIKVPSAVRDIVAARLVDLSDADRDLLDAASVQGFEFESDYVARVCDAPRIHVLRRLAALERRSGVVRSAGRSYRFDHHQIQDLLYTGLPQELREAYHTMLAEACAEREGDNPHGEAAVFLATHHLQGSHPDRALSYVEPALDHLKRSYRSGAALRLMNRALEIPDLLAGTRRVGILIRKTERQDLLGKWDEQKDVLEEAAALADESGDPGLRSRAQRAWGIHLAHIAAYEEALVRFTKAREFARAAQDREQEANAERNMGTACHRLGRIEEARKLFEGSLAISHELGDREGETKTTGNLGIVFVLMGRRGEARGYFEKALELSRERGDRVGEAAIVGNLGVICLDLGRYAEARKCFERKLTLAREIGYRKAEVAALGALGTILANLGRFAEARERLERYLALATEMGDRLEHGYALSTLGAVAEGEGDPEGAERLHEEALSLRREVGYTQGVVDSLIVL